ncbi:MAG: hypothetical protein M0P01_04375 [Treponema sp.]|nr:hypothetical protein [Treponema sp.]
MMKKITAAAFASASLLLLPLPAFDFGGKIGSTTKYQGNAFDSLKLYESSTSHLWVSSLLNEDTKLRFNADGSYEFRYDETDASYKNILDVNLLKLSGTLSSGRYTKLNFAAGRFFVSDVTGIVFSQVSDGFYTKFETPSLDFDVYAGTTALLNAHDVTIITPETTAYNPDFNTVYAACPPYVPVGISMNFPSLFLNQTLTAEGWGFIDFSSDKYNRWYGTAAVSGPLAGNVFYSLMTTAGTEKFDSISDLSKVTVTLYPVPTASIAVSGVYASGKNGFLSGFTGFTSRTAYLSLPEPEYTGIIKADLSGSYTVTSNFCLSGGGACVFACPDDIVTYDGLQWSFNAVWNIFYDLQLSAGAYQYYAQDSAGNKTCFIVTGTFVF